MGPKFTRTKSFVSISASRCRQLKQGEKGFPRSFWLCSDGWNPSAASARIRLRITTRCHRVNVTPALSEPLVEHLFICFFPIYNQSGIQIMWEALHDPAGQSAQWHALQSKLFNGFTARWRRARQEPDCCSWVCLSLFLQSQSGGDVLVGVGERLKADATVKKKEGKKGKKRKWTINAGRSLWVCTHVCTRAYIRGLPAYAKV